MCALFGIFDVAEVVSSRLKKRLFRNLANASMVRGKGAIGFAYFSNHEIRTFKTVKPANKMNIFFPNSTKCICGHTRAFTKGSPLFNDNNHPFLGHTGNTSFALAHNGIIFNDTYLKISHELPLSPIQTDSYVAVQLLEEAG